MCSLFVPTVYNVVRRNCYLYWITYIIPYMTAPFLIDDTSFLLNLALARDY